MFKFNKNNFFGLFFTIFVALLYNVACNGSEPVLLGYVTFQIDDESTSDDYSDIENNIVVNFDPLNKYILKGNVINFGDESHLLKFDSKIPTNCDFYIRAIKVKDGFGNNIQHDPNTSNQYLDSGWIKYKGLATLDYLRSSLGLWHTYGARFLPNDKIGDYGLTRVVHDISRSTYGRDVFNLYDKNNNAIVPGIFPEELPVEESES